jgi:hypothetical protein
LQVCAHCHRDVPALDFCVRCGHRLEHEGDAVRRTQARRGTYAAAPHEHMWTPHIASTLFPQLPRADAGAFLAALVIGLAGIGLLAILELYPLALLVSAVLLPVLFVFYLYAANVYESKPGLALGVTVGWGVAVGVVLGLFARHIGISFDSHGFDNLGEADVIKRVFILPIAAFVATVIAIVVLYVAPRYDEVLDGIAFGATTAVAIAAAQTVVQAATLLRDGFKADGALSAWLIRLSEVALLTPITWIGGAAVMAAALWMGGRVPLRDRARVGIVANPFVAAVLGVVMFVLPGFVLQGMNRNLAFAVLIAIALGSLVLVRAVVHIGLLEEGELLQDEANEITCANCHRSTPSGLFCGRCGIALRALPKARAEADA